MDFWILLLIAGICLVVAVLAFCLLGGVDSDLAAMALITVGTFTLVGAGACLLGFGIIHLDQAGCHEHGERLGVKTEYTLLSGCYVEVDGRSIPYDRWIDISKEDGS